MTAGKTYVPIATTTLGSAAASYTFSSIPATYTDLVLVIGGGVSAGMNLGLQFNGDTATNYSDTLLYGTGSAAGSSRDTTQAQIRAASAGGAQDIAVVVHIMNYANTTTYKSALVRANTPAYMTILYAGLWRSTAAINAVKVTPDSANLTSGTVLTLYGILAA